MSTAAAPDPFEMDDAAYVLGALRGAELAAFEAHLRTCADCTARVADARRIQAALSGISEDDLLAELEVAEPDPVPDTVLPSLLRAVRTERRRRRGLVVGLASVAAASVIALTLVLAWPSGHKHSPALAMSAVRPTPVHATAQLDSVDWGTAITLVCHYSGVYHDVAYSLVVVRKDGTSEGAGSWELKPGEVTTWHGGTAWSKAQISKIEIVYGSTEVLQLQL